MTNVRECPGCGAKFQHDSVSCVCKRCGLPDEVVAAGPVAVGRWMRRAARAGQPQAMEALGRAAGRGGSALRRRRAHGRPRGGSKRVGK